MMDSAAADTDVLRSLDEQGDDFSLFRQVDFLIRTDDSDKAETISGFDETTSVAWGDIEGDGVGEVTGFAVGV